MESDASFLGSNFVAEGIAISLLMKNSFGGESWAVWTPFFPQVKPWGVCLPLRTHHIGPCFPNSSELTLSFSPDEVPVKGAFDPEAVVAIFGLVAASFRAPPCTENYIRGCSSLGKEVPAVGCSVAG